MPGYHRDVCFFPNLCSKWFVTFEKKKKSLNNNTLDLIVLHFGIAFHETLTLTVACYFRGTDFYDEIVIN